MFWTGPSALRVQFDPSSNPRRVLGRLTGLYGSSLRQELIALCAPALFSTCAMAEGERSTRAARRCAAHSVHHLHHVHTKNGGRHPH